MGIKVPVIFAAALCLLTLVGHIDASTKTTTGKPLREDPTSSQDPPTCGYESCPKPQPGKLNVHLVPHTHNDVGWLKTVDQYYYGSKTKVQKAGVQYIIDSVLKELLHDPQKRFIYVETAFWWKWWMKQHDTVRHQVKKVVNTGQLEFISGGWSMNDEAVTNYQSTIDQMTWGFRKLNDTFGKCGRPHIGWQIDPFGHSRETASIFARMGFDGLFLGRLDFQDKLTRLQTKTAEMVWQGSANLGKEAELFTSILFNNYSPPPGFCFDVLCNDEPFIDDKRSPDYNVDDLVKKFIDYAGKQAGNYSTDNILMTMGEDFNYQDANMWFKNLDKLIRYVNAYNDSINVFYSTPSCYLKAVHDTGKTWTTKKDDFFPYASDPHTYWTGYFTSRPTLKRFERLGNNFLQACKQLYSLMDLGPEDWVDLNKMREAMGIMQHHDAVTGTEKQKVASDYARILYEGFEECGIIAETAINKMMASKEESDKGKATPVPVQSCLLLNISQCYVSENSNQFVVTVYNPLSHPISHYVRVPVSGASYTVQDPTGKQVKVQMLPVPQPIVETPGRVSSATLELVFQAVDLPPLGYRSYYISKSNRIHRMRQYKSHSGKDVTLGNSKFNAVLNGKTGTLKSVHVDGVKFTVEQDFYYYKGYLGDNQEFANRSSGAYIFRPNGTDALSVSSTPKLITYKGDIVDETHVKWSDWLSQVTRVYKNEQFPHIELGWTVGPIPIDDDVGKEIISRFSSNLPSNGLFYTDSNGREMLERKRDFRPTWSIKIEEPVSANYYPVTSRIALRNSEAEMSVLTDRAQGGASLKDGELELMVHRRLLHDDAFGVGEALNETAFGYGLVATGKHWLTGGSVPNGTAAQRARSLQQQLLLSPWLFFSPANNISFVEWASAYKMEFTGLTEALPENVHILTLEPWKAHTFLLRLEHIYEKNEHPVLSKPVTVNLQNLFTPFSIATLRETTLGGNKWLSESQRFKWRSESNEIDSGFEEMQSQLESSASEDFEDDYTITLNPMQIHTFIIEIHDAK